MPTCPFIGGFTYIAKYQPQSNDKDIHYSYKLLWTNLYKQQDCEDPVLLKYNLLISMETLDTDQGHCMNVLHNMYVTWRYNKYINVHHKS